jgi:hypothetical protein
MVNGDVKDEEGTESSGGWIRCEETDRGDLSQRTLRRSTEFTEKEGG